MDFDTVIHNATLIDGTGRPRFRSHLGIRQGKIAAISETGPLEGRETIDASGLILSPGFIDIHSHADWILPLPDHAGILAPLVLQGITTVVCGNCGFSPAPLTEGKEAMLDSFQR